jgi:tetratricopeptide (TPR) repeat protein
MRHSLAALALGVLILDFVQAPLYGQNSTKNTATSPGYVPPSAAAPAVRPVVPAVRPPTWYAPPTPTTVYPYYVAPGDASYGYYGGYSPYYPGYLPPVFAPAESAYGPGAAQRFIGGDDSNSSPAYTRPSRRADRTLDDEPSSSQRSTNSAATALGRKYIGYGDENFHNQRYSEANQRYRKATLNAPAMAEGYFRAGFALVALGHYDAAAQIFKRGLNVDPTWPQSQFRIDDLYGANQSDKAAHLESLAKAATEDPRNGDLLFLVGTELYFDSQKDRARIFFERADQLIHGNDAHLKGFLAGPNLPQAVVPAENGLER